MASIHGYSLSSDYTQKFYRELSPDWIDLSLIANGFLPPRSQNKTDQFKYLELGCGLGLTLIFLAALYPEGAFVGIDFSTSHIAKAQHFANQLGIANIRFIQADFAKISLEPSHYGIKKEDFNYVVAHGLMTWVSPEVQDAVLNLTARSLACGGAFYASYNCLPGWLPANILQNAFKIFNRDQSEDFNSHNTYIQSRDCLNALIKNGTNGASPLHSNHPGLGRWIEFMDQQDPRYIEQEFGTTHWAPVYSGDFHREINKYQLIFASSCTYPDNLKELLSPVLRDELSKLSSPFDRESIEDIGCNRSFRRDIFIKGPIRISNQHAFKLAEILNLFLVRPDELNKTIELNGPCGPIGANREAYAPILELLLQEQCRLSDLFSKLPISQTDCFNRVLLLLDKGIVGFNILQHKESLADNLHLVNTRIIEGCTAGQHCGYLIAPNASNVAPIDLASSIILLGIHKDLSGQRLRDYVLSQLLELGVAFTNEDSDEKVAKADIQLHIKSLIDRFLQQKLPYLRYLGAFD